MWHVKGSYLRVHFRVPATFTFPQTLGLPSLQQLTPEAFLGIKPAKTDKQNNQDLKTVVRLPK